MSRRIFQTAKFLVVHTNRMAVELRQQYGIDPSRVIVVEHGIDRVIHPTPGLEPSMRKTLGLGSAERVMLFFGAIARYKGVDLLIKAFGLPDAAIADKLVIAGRCRDPALAIELHGLIAEHPRRDAILWRDGFVADDDVVPLFHAADLLVLPYRHIDQSGVIFMALATGLRTVVTDVGSLCNYIPPGFGGVSVANDPEALAACIKVQMALPVKSNTMHFAERFLWKNTVKSILPWYQHING